MNIGFSPETCDRDNSLHRFFRNYRLVSIINHISINYVLRFKSQYNGFTEWSVRVRSFFFARENFPRPRAPFISFVIQPQHTKYLRSFHRRDSWIFIMIIFSLLVPCAKTELFCDLREQANRGRNWANESGAGH